MQSGIGMVRLLVRTVNPGFVDMQYNALVFWRDEAKLDILSPEKRWKFYLKLLLSVLYLAGLVPTILKLTSLAQSEPVMVGAIFAMLAYPLSVIIDLACRGGEAGARLMNERESAHKLHAALQEKVTERKPTASEVGQLLYALSERGRQLSTDATLAQRDEWIQEILSFVSIALSPNQYNLFIAETRRPQNNDGNIACRQEVSKKAQWALLRHNKLTDHDINTDCTASQLSQWRTVLAK